MSDGSTFTGLFGRDVPMQITGLTRHDWMADAQGLYHTQTNLAAEWAGVYAQAAAGHAAALLPYQRLEADAAVLFQNTKIATLDAATQARDREDVQREIDAVDAAMRLAGASAAAPLTQATYLATEHTLQANPVLEELAVQGHGLNTPPAQRYDGYTNDFQNGVDATTLYVGAGHDHNDNALTAYADDILMTHIPFPVVMINGHAVQLNQNAARETGLGTAVAEANQGLFGRVVTAADFAQTAAPAPAHAAGHTPTVTAGPKNSVFGASLPATIMAGHTWTADAAGLYHTAADLLSEWRGLYTQMLAGKGAVLTATQRMEGNAEAIFENTGLSKLDAAMQVRDREDVQRELDAIGAAMRIDAMTLGIPVSARFTVGSYLAMEQTIQGNAALEELAMQGHGLNKPPLGRYAGYTNDMQNAVDPKTRFVGAGVDHGERAVRDFMDDVIMTHAPFATVYINGVATQLNQNGAAESTVTEAVAGINETAFDRVFTAVEFRST